MAVVYNQVSLEGRLNRMDVKKGIAKTGNEFISVTFTLQIGETQLRVENFSMRNKKDGTELSSYQGLMTLFLEAKALHKTYKDIGEKEAKVMKNEDILKMRGIIAEKEILGVGQFEPTIVENIDDCDAIRFSNYGNFKYCRIEENSYVKDRELIKNLRLVGASPNRVDETKKEYTPTADFEVAGVITAPPVQPMDAEYMQFKVMVPVYTEAWGEREAKVDLVEITIRLNDESAFGYVEDEFTIGAFVSLNGTIIREVQRVEIEVPIENEGRGFGRQVKHEAKYGTNIVEYYNLLGGYTLEEDEVEMTPALNMDLWSVAKEEKEQKEAEMLANADADKPKQGFGRPDAKKEVKKPQSPKLPF